MRRISPSELDELPEFSMVMDRDFDVYVKMGKSWFYSRGAGVDPDHEDDPMEDMGDYEPLYLLRDGLDVLPMEQISPTQVLSIGTSSMRRPGQNPKEAVASIIAYREAVTFVRHEVPSRVWDWVERVEKAHREYCRGEQS